MKVHQQITALMPPRKAQVEFVLSYLESLGYFGRGLNPGCSAAAVVERYDATEDEWKLLKRVRFLIFFSCVFPPSCPSCVMTNPII